MDQELLKITYHLSGKKINAYVKKTWSYLELKNKIELCLFEERKQPRCEIRTFWIDEDKDEIEIHNQYDYDIFLSAQSESPQRLQIAPIGMDVDDHISSANDAASSQTEMPPAAGSYEYAVHDRIECDACLMAPIVGFRYKCIECANYDLCQNCEAKHVHSEHMMVRMPTNNCPSVVEAYVTGRSSGRRHGKRSKTACPFVKNGLSLIIDDNAEAQNSSSDKNAGAEQSSTTHGKESRHHGRKYGRHQRNNFFSNLFEMIISEAAGGVDSTAYAMGESPTPAATTSNDTGLQNAENTIVTATAAAAVAKVAAEQAQETAAKAAEIAAKVVHETALMAAKNSATNVKSTNSATATESGEKEKVDGNSTPQASEPQAHNVRPSPSLEGIAQFLDPNFVKSGVQILNNFSDMFSKILDPMENADSSNNNMYPSLRKNSTASNQSSISTNINMGFDKKSDEYKSLEKEQENLNNNSTTSIKSAPSAVSNSSNSVGSEKKIDEYKSIEKDEENLNNDSINSLVSSNLNNLGSHKNTGSNASSHVEIDDLGSESENEGFVKIYTTKKTSESKPTTAVASAQTSANQSLDSSNSIDFVQIGEELKAHIAKEGVKDEIKTGSNITESVENSNEVIAPTTTSTLTSPTTLNANVEKRAVPVYHADQRINNSVHAMMAMGFSNEGAWLTQLLESVNGNISEALDLMSAAQRGGSR